MNTRDETKKVLCDTKTNDECQSWRLELFRRAKKCVQLTKHCERVIISVSFQVEVIRMHCWICANSCSLNVFQLRVNNKLVNKKSVEYFMMYAISATEPMYFAFNLSQTMKWNDLTISCSTQASFFSFSLLFSMNVTVVFVNQFGRENILKNQVRKRK